MTDAEDISDLWEDALDNYEKMAPKRPRRDQKLFMTLTTPDELEAHLSKHEESFKLFRSKHGKLTSRLKACMKPFMALSDMISAAVSASPFAPASTVLGAVCFVLKAADGVSEVYAWIEELFDKLRDFTVRLDKYVQQGLPKGFRDKIIDIFGCLLEILACAELAVKDGRWKKYAAVLFLGGDERVKAAFDKLSGLFESEQALVLAISYATNQKMDRRIEEIGAMSEAILDATNNAQEERMRLNCLEWISKLDASAQQSDNLGRRQANTGEWFLQNSTFNDWISGSDQAWALFCPGAPGAGKTTMSATVVHHLSTLGSANEIGIAYIYCNYRSRNEQTLYNLLTAVLRRLCQVRSSVPQYVIDAYTQIRKDRRLTLQECTDLVALVCREFSTVYIVVDAVDECKEDVSRELLKTISLIQKQSKVRLLVTSRFITSIQEMIQTELGVLPQIEVRASDEDIRGYFIGRQPGFQNFLKNNKDLCNLACDKVVKAAGGMFLLARLHVDQLAAMVVPAQVKNALARMFSIPDDTSQSAEAYDEQYDLAMERITGQPSYQAGLARATLAWMTFACRPLTPAELCHALAMSLSDDQGELDQDYLPEIGLLVSICAGLITVDNEANVVRPVHYTTQEYLERTHETWLPGGKRQTALACLSYLCLDEFKKGAPVCYGEGEDEYQLRLETYPFFNYAAHNWGEHCRSIQSELFDEISVLFRYPGITDSISSVTTDFWQDIFYGEMRTWELLHPMLLITREGLIQTLRKFLFDDTVEIDSKIYAHDTTSCWLLPQAVENGYLELVSVICSQEKDFSLLDGSGYALEYAAARENVAIMQVILDLWTKSSLKCNLPAARMNEFLDSALKIAAINGSVKASELLLSRRADSKALDSALNEAISKEHEQVARLLLQHGAKPDYTIHRGVQDHNEGALRILLELGTSVDSLDDEGNTALQIAASSDVSESIILLLLENGADASIVNERLGHALHAAAESRSMRNVRVLINSGVEIDAKSSLHDTALIAAVTGYPYCGRWITDSDVVRYLLDHGAQADKHYGGSAGNALQITALHGDEELCTLLLDRGADINLRSGIPERTALQAACQGARANTVELLLSRGATENECGISFSGEYMEDWVDSDAEPLEVLQLLIDQGIKVDLEGDGTHEPAIYAAVRSGNTAILRGLLRLGANINSEAGEHGNVLHTALVMDRNTTYGKHVECVNILLDHGVDPNTPGSIHKTTLGAALYAYGRLEHPGYDDTTIPLLEHKVNVGDHGSALLEQSVTVGAAHVVRYLLQAGVDVASSTSRCPNLLVAACHASDPEDILTLLVDAGVDIMVHGVAALHEAAYLDAPVAATWLLKHGADANGTGETHPNALITSVSVEKDHQYDFKRSGVSKIIRELIEHGADIRVHGPAALKLALANHYDDEVVSLLGGGRQPRQYVIEVVLVFGVAKVVKLSQF